MISRRRFLTIAAAAAVASPSRAAENVSWQGRAMGTSARVVLTGTDQSSARRLFRKIERLLARVETRFSLHTESGLVRLNRTGRWPWPDPDVLALFRLAAQVHAATVGAFDPTIQPLWQATATGGDIDAARKLVGWRDVVLSEQEIRLARPGMAVTFNGIAQGHAADQVATLLRQAGYRDVLVDIGEINAMGRRPDGKAWQAAIALPDGRTVGAAALQDRALAVSSPAGTLIGPGAAHGHILDPAGRGQRWQISAVTAPSAALADALSTAFCVMERAEIDAALTVFPDARIAALG
ncbi:FAD:protein FMN transferase [Roseibium sp. Sym1]|uniref:FAD:protein FMN transferase n=1 Tax=Roseibium sp. Sym1 TaxID=3016006 RepID=UPI0022B4221B|nr:FAD:protein FMN transferase [Roseibium sp. Sym1]